MTQNNADTQWYIARDGQQHGPLSESEMRTFLEMRHLRATDLVWRPGFSDWRPAPLVFASDAQGEVQDVPAPLRDRQAAAEPAEPVTSRATGLEPEPMAGASGSLVPEDDRGETDPNPDLHPGRGGFAGTGIEAGWLMAAAAGGIVIVSAIWLGVTYGGGLLGMAEGPVPPASEQMKADIAVPVETAATAAGNTLDARFQRMPIWSAVKREFPEWYGERLDEAAKLAASDEPEAAITKHLAEALVALRRRHADAALSASDERLRRITTTFLANLSALEALGTDKCYSFISQGEASPIAIELLLKPDESRAVQDQVIAVIDAIADGRKSSIPHEGASKADYDALAGGLMQLGWTKADLALFGDPDALARSTPDRVCRMVQDFYRAHMALKDGGMQGRLLSENLRPVVN